MPQPLRHGRDVITSEAVRVCRQVISAGDATIEVRDESDQAVFHGRLDPHFVVVDDTAVEVRIEGTPAAMPLEFTAADEVYPGVVGFELVQGYAVIRGPETDPVRG
jgi:hypothetical protein